MLIHARAYADWSQKHSRLASKEALTLGSVYSFTNEKFFSVYVANLEGLWLFNK